MALAMPRQKADGALLKAARTFMRAGARKHARATAGASSTGDVSDEFVTPSMTSHRCWMAFAPIAPR